MCTRVAKMFIKPAECVVFRTVLISCRKLALELTLHTCQRLNYVASHTYVISAMIKRTIFRKVRRETILKLYNTLVLPTFLYWSEN
jgi:hypothetical protein